MNVSSRFGNSKLFIVLTLFSIMLGATGCSDSYFISGRNSVTSNGTVYDPSRSFELLSFCTASSFSTASTPDGLNCSLGNITDVQYDNVSGNWSCMSCSWDSTKCSTSFNVSNISSYPGLNLTAEHILSSNYDNSGFGVMCCNAAGSQCYFPKLLSVNGTYEACGAGYNEIVGSVSFNNVSNDWVVTSCLDGFK